METNVFNKQKQLTNQWKFLGTQCRPSPLGALPQLFSIHKNLCLSYINTLITWFYINTTQSRFNERDHIDVYSFPGKRLW